MWQLKGLDNQVMALRSLEGPEARDIVPVFIRFVRKIVQRHPCSLNSRAVTRLRRHDGIGEYFVLVLPHDWHATYRIVPNCEADEGEIELLHTGPLKLPI